MSEDRSTACLDWEKRILAHESLIPCGALFPTEAKRALTVFKALRLVDLQNHPTMGDVCRPWIIDFVSVLFGAYDPGDIPESTDETNGRRLIQEFFLSVAKKNSKSTIAAAVMMTALIRNWRDSGEFFILAPTVEVANNSFYPARDMVRADEELSDLFLVQEHVRQITHRRNGASLKVIAAESETVGGKKGIGILIDELHAFGNKAGAQNMIVEACGGLASRPEGFVIYLTTQSEKPPAGVFKQKLQYARGVRDGRIKDNKFLPVLFEFPKKLLDEKAYLEPDKLWITNPNLGASVDEEFLRHKLKQAEEDGGEALNIYLAKHANVEPGLALGSDRWAGADFWQARGNKTLTLEELIRRCEVITAGVDFGGLDDWLALSFTGREKETGVWLHWAHAWVHPIAFDRRKQEAARWKDFVADGDLTVVGEVGDEVSAVIAFIMKIEKSGLLERVGVDRYKIQEIFDGLIKAGLAEDRIVAIDQGWKLVGAISTTERRLASGRFLHGGSAMMAYCVGNCKVEAKGNNIIISKQTAGASKIDPVMATFNSVALMALNPEPAKKKFQFFAVG